MTGTLPLSEWHNANLVTIENHWMQGQAKVNDKAARHWESLLFKPSEIKGLPQLDLEPA